MDVKYVCWDGVEWIDSARGRHNWQFIFKAVKYTVSHGNLNIFKIIALWNGSGSHDSPCTFEFRKMREISWLAEDWIHFKKENTPWSYLVSQLPYITSGHYSK